MKVNKISRRAFLLGLGAVSTAALLSACGGSASSSSAASGSAASGSAAAAGSDVFRTLDEIKADGTVNIGVFSDKNPFGYVDENGEYQGYDVYFARRLAEDLGVEANFVSTEAANRIEYLQTGKVDIILANFTVTPERAEEVDFALPYMNVALGVISPDSNVITSLDNWNADDQMIVISGTTAETYLTKEYPDIPLQKYDSYATAKNALENGNGVAWANDNTEVIAFASQNCKLHLCVVGNFLLVHSLKPPSKILCHAFLKSVAVAIAQVNQPFGRECEKQMPDNSFVYSG